MKTLNYDDVDIVGFGGLRENILVMGVDRFGHKRRDDTWREFGQLEYLAHAFFRPGGSTGKHSHSSVDIITVVTRGRILHQGTLGDNDEIKSGQVLTQYSGKKGFEHNEINPDSDVHGLVQIWMKPSGIQQHEPCHKITELLEGENRIYKGETTTLDILWLSKNNRIAAGTEALGYVYEGSISAIEDEQEYTLSRGTLFKAGNCSFFPLHETAKIILVTRHR